MDAAIHGTMPLSAAHGDRAHVTWGASVRVSFTLMGKRSASLQRSRVRISARAATGSCNHRYRRREHSVVTCARRSAAGGNRILIRFALCVCRVPGNQRSRSDRPEEPQACSNDPRRARSGCCRHCRALGASTQFHHDSTITYATRGISVDGSRRRTPWCRDARRATVDTGHKNDATLERCSTGLEKYSKPVSGTGTSMV